MHVILKWFESNLGKLTLLAIVAILALIAIRVLGKIMRRALTRSDIPNASIFINLMRVLVWVVAACFVLNPVFGVNPTTLFTALGIGGIAVSLGLKDSISNIISGFGLMFGKVIKPGDAVSVNGVSGTVEDITWRQTAVRERNGNRYLIPNSVLTTSAVEKLNTTNESLVQVPFTAKVGVDVDVLTKRLLTAVIAETGDVVDLTTPPRVRFSGLSVYGPTGNIFAFAKPGQAVSTVADAVTRAIVDCDLLEMRACNDDVYASVAIDNAVELESAKSEALANKMADVAAGEQAHAETQAAIEAAAGKAKAQQEAEAQAKAAEKSKAKTQQESQAAADAADAADAATESQPKVTTATKSQPETASVTEDASSSEVTSSANNASQTEVASASEIPSQSQTASAAKDTSNATSTTHDSTAQATETTTSTTADVSTDSANSSTADAK